MLLESICSSTVAGMSSFSGIFGLTISSLTAAAASEGSV